MRPVLAKYQFSPTKVLHGVVKPCAMLSGENWYLARTGPTSVPLHNAFLNGRGYRNGYPFPEGENFILGEMDLFPEDSNCTWGNGYLFAEAANRPRGNGYVPGSQHGPRNGYALYTDCRFPKSITQLGKP